MSFCVTGIIGLQLYWNYQNYQRMIKTFNHDINTALNNAVNREITSRHDEITGQFKNWLRDTSMVRITCSNDNPRGNTVFHLADTHPLYEDKGASMGLVSFKRSLPQITPAAKEAFIRHFADTTLKEDLKKGVVYYYTQRLGNRLDSVYDHSVLDLARLKEFYRQELEAIGIHAAFELSLVNKPISNKPYVSRQVNTSLRRPYHKELISAAFESPDLWFLKEMKWLMLTSIVLIAITLCCFGFTVKTLLSQQQLVLLKENFINNVTHELNTPIASIKITAEALRTFQHDAETRDEYLKMIAYQTDRLSLLANQVLDFGKTNAASAMQVIHLDGLIKEVITDLRTYSSSLNASIEFSPANNPVYVRAEKESMMKVMINLLENAIKYSAAAADISVSLKQVRQQVEIMVSDHGIGIPPEYHEKVFERFFRVPQGDVHNVKGYGLGLSYVKQVIDQYGGIIAVSANLPAGTSFTIYLPVC